MYLHSYTHLRSQKWVVSPWFFWHLNLVIPGKTQWSCSTPWPWWEAEGFWWENDGNMRKIYVTYVTWWENVGKCGKNTANHEHLCKFSYQWRLQWETPLRNGGFSSKAPFQLLDHINHPEPGLQADFSPSVTTCFIHGKTMKCLYSCVYMYNMEDS